MQELAGCDPKRISAAYDALSEQSVYLRFMRAKQPATAEQLAFFLDYPREPQMGLLLTDEQGTPLAMAQSVRRRLHPDRAGVLLHRRGSFQHRGAGRRILLALARWHTGRDPGVDGGSARPESPHAGSAQGARVAAYPGDRTGDGLCQAGSRAHGELCAPIGLRPRANGPPLAPVLRSACYPLEENNHGAVSQTYRDPHRCRHLAESGIKTFRACDGLWEEHRVEDVATPEGYARIPNWYNVFYNARRHQLQRRDPPQSGPLCIGPSGAPAAGRVTLVTQNIDNLHESAGSKNLIHMHGGCSRPAARARVQVIEWRGDLHQEELCSCCQFPHPLRPMWSGSGDAPRT